MLSIPPLSKRVYSRTRVTTARRDGLVRDVCYKDWTYERMTKAMQAVTEEGMSIRRAATEYNIP